MWRNFTGLTNSLFSGIDRNVWSSVLTRSISSCLWTGRVQTGRAESGDLLMTSQARCSGSRSLVDTFLPESNLQDVRNCQQVFFFSFSFFKWKSRLHSCSRYPWGKWGLWFCPQTWAGWRDEQSALALRYLRSLRRRRPAQKRPTVASCRVQSPCKLQRRDLPPVHRRGLPAWEMNFISLYLVCKRHDGSAFN